MAFSPVCTTHLNDSLPNKLKHRWPNRAEHLRKGSVISAPSDAWSLDWNYLLFTAIRMRAGRWTKVSMIHFCDGMPQHPNPSSKECQSGEAQECIFLHREIITFRDLQFVHSLWLTLTKSVWSWMHSYLPSYHFTEVDSDFN